MVYWLDYSAAKLDGQTIKNAGYSGVIRYIDSPENLGRKHTNVGEYQSHVKAGLSVLLVMQTTTTASDGGYPVGQEHARRALAGADLLGYTGPIFFTNDRTTVPNPAAWRAYLDGAASVLGIGRTGAYGFRNAMDLAVGHASFFWQAGRRSDVAAHVHAWQDNNTQVTVGGVLCDRNLILKAIEENDMQPTDLVIEPGTGQPAKDINGNNYTYGAAWYYDNLNGWVIRDGIAELKAQQAATQASIAAIATNRDITPDELAAIVNRAVAENTPTAEQAAAALLPLVEGITERVLAADNSALAEEFLRQLRAALPAPKTGGN